MVSNTKIPATIPQVSMRNTRSPESVSFFLFSTAFVNQTAGPSDTLITSTNTTLTRSQQSPPRVQNTRNAVHKVKDPLGDLSGRQGLSQRRQFGTQDTIVLASGLCFVCCCWCCARGPLTRLFSQDQVCLAEPTAIPGYREAVRPFTRSIHQSVHPSIGGRSQSLAC